MIPMHPLEVQASLDARARPSRPSFLYLCLSGLLRFGARNDLTRGHLTILFHFNQHIGRV